MLNPANPARFFACGCRSIRRYDLSAVVTRAICFAAALGLASCASLEQLKAENPYMPPVSTGPYREASATTLMAYGASLSILDAAGRAFECQRVLNAYRGDRQLPVLFHLFVAQAAPPGCGDLRATAREVQAMRSGVTDPMLRNFLAVQMLTAEGRVEAAAERQDLERALRRARSNLKQSISRHRQSISQVRDTYRRMKSRDAEARQLKQRVDELKSVEQGLSQSVRSRDAEARQLKEKLDALKSIEREINETERREDYD
jgi:hypothetical protein